MMSRVVTGAAPVSIYASVTKGLAPVIGAQATATIESPSSTFSPIEIQLRDDGLGPDLDKDDGIYSAIMLNTEVTGKHTVSVNVVGADDSKVKKFLGLSVPIISGQH